jgi:hypothetical protein
VRGGAFSGLTGLEGAAVGGAGCSPQPPLGGSLAGGPQVRGSEAAGRHGCAPHGDAMMRAGPPTR